MTIILLGKQASGKTRVSKELEKLGYEKILEYTTRPMRPGETDGVEYHFVTPEQYKKIDFVADRMFPMVTGDANWGISREDLESDKDQILVTNPGACKQIIDAGAKNLLIVYLYVDKDTQISRLRARGDDPKEYERRMIADNKDFLGLKCHLIMENKDGSPEDTAKAIIALSKMTKTPKLKDVQKI